MGSSRNEASLRCLTYGSLTFGSMAMTPSALDAATVVDVNTKPFDTGLSAIGSVAFANLAFSDNFFLLFSSIVLHAEGEEFRRGDDNSPISPYGGDFGLGYTSDGLPLNGALLNSTDNWFYAISETDNSQRVWLQFHFTGDGNGTIVKAVFPSFIGELPSAAAAAAVPEPSSLLLLSLGTSGLLIRRRKSA